MDIACKVLHPCDAELLKLWLCGAAFVDDLHLNVYNSEKEHVLC